jgi:hypothetical protein
MTFLHEKLNNLMIKARDASVPVVTGRLGLSRAEYSIGLGVQSD